MAGRESKPDRLRGPFFLAFFVLYPPERDPSGFGREDLEVEADAIAIFMLPSCADLEPEVVDSVLRDIKFMRDQAMLLILE